MANADIENRNLTVDCELDRNTPDIPVRGENTEPRQPDGRDGI